jgi:endonuclease III
MPEIQKQSIGTVALLDRRPNTYRVPPLCYGNYEAWKLFLSGGGYFSVTHKGTFREKVNPLSPSKQQRASEFVEAILAPDDASSTQERGWKNRQLGFHNSMRLLRMSFIAAPRDLWESCLPSRDKYWYEFAVLLLMLCSSVIPDARLVPEMKVIFSRYEMTPEFVLLKFKNDPRFWEHQLHDLGRQVSNAENWVLAAQTTQTLGRVPRNYTDMMLNYHGVGPKIALVTIHSSYGDVVSQPLDD